MLDPNNQPTDQNNPPTDTPPADTPPDLSPQEMLEALIEARGGIPTPAEGEELSEREVAMMENQFKLETRLNLQDMQKLVDTKIPDATDQQSFAIAEAHTKGDLSGVIDAVLSAQKHAQEVDDKKQEQGDLHVEGGASGKGDDDGKDVSMAGLFEKIADKYDKPA